MRLPLALFVIAVAFVVMFAAFRSLVLPVKAILMNVVSLGAALGVVVLVFQEGHLASWLGYSATGSIEPKQVTRQDEIHDVPSPVPGQRTLARGTRYDPKPVLARVIEPIDRFADVVSSEDRQALQGSERSVSRNPFDELANRR